jgi:hypothetical protein
MRFSGLILRVLRPSGVELSTRIAGLLLSAIAGQLIVEAIKTLSQMDRVPGSRALALAGQQPRCWVR